MYIHRYLLQCSHTFGPFNCCFVLSSGACVGPGNPRMNHHIQYRPCHEVRVPHLNHFPDFKAIQNHPKPIYFMVIMVISCTQKLLGSPFQPLGALEPAPAPGCAGGSSSTRPWRWTLTEPCPTVRRCFWPCAAWSVGPVALVMGGD